MYDHWIASENPISVSFQPKESKCQVKSLDWVYQRQLNRSRYASSSDTHNFIFFSLGVHMTISMVVLIFFHLFFTIIRPNRCLFTRKKWFFINMIQWGLRQTPIVFCLRSRHFSETPKCNRQNTIYGQNKSLNHFSSFGSFALSRILFRNSRHNSFRT